MAKAKIGLIEKKTSTLHDFPYNNPQRKCAHFWIINVTPPGYDHCIHKCSFCYAREAIFSKGTQGVLQIYYNLPELVEKDLEKLTLCPPISISNITDPCQDIPELKMSVRRLIRVIMDYGVSFMITTKGDPEFLFDLAGFCEYKNKFIAFSIEGTPEVLRRLSPKAPSFDQRIKSIQKTAKAGIKVSIRLDPLFIHLFMALYGDNWFDKVKGLIRIFSDIGCSHVVCSTGRLAKKRQQVVGSSIYQRIYDAIYRESPQCAKDFLNDYKFERSYTSQGYFLRRDLRLDLHRRLRTLCEERGMTYSTCLENHYWETDSKGIPHCEGILIPFTRKGSDGRFRAIDGCTANCHVTCKNSLNPPCGCPQLAVPAPFKVRHLTLFQPIPRWNQEKLL